jgi:hypothetical protein
MGANESSGIPSKSLSRVVSQEQWGINLIS